jgi:hypothetical protein
VRGTRKNGNGGVALSLQFIVDREERIAKLQYLIAELKRKGRPTKLAEAELRRDLQALAMLRNHCDLSLALMKPNRYDTPLGDPSV